MSWFCSTSLRGLITVLNICSKYKKLSEQGRFTNPQEVAIPSTLLLPGKLVN